MTARRCARALVFLGLALMLCGCSTTPETVYVDRIVEVRPTVAPSLLQCRPEPAPLPSKSRQRDVAPYVLDLVEAGQDCRRKLGSVGRIVVGATP